MVGKNSPVLVSACLAGVCCRYDGKDNSNPYVMDLVQKGVAIPVCPEQLGGLPTPRTPAERVGNRVIQKDGTDVTKEYERGAQETLKIAQLTGCKTAILKARSPSCGKGEIYDGTFTHTKIHGNGVCTQVLLNHSIEVLTEEEVEK